MTLGAALTIRNVIFDLDGTLIDSRPGIEACLRRALDAASPGGELPPVESLIGPPVRQMIAALLPGRDPATVDAAETEFRRCYDAGGWRMIETYEGADAVLQSLAAAGLHLFVLTNKPAGPTRVILDHLGWHDRFDAVLCRDSACPPFDDKPAALRWLLEQRGLESASTIVVGDSAEDALAARSNGVRFAAACWGYGTAQSESAVECLLAKIADLPSLLDVDG